ncbi:hypothetical protein [Inquilinus limosus]|uniref:hypothetical protein n=1 Tax=Inquilinus limosus TaxID=171674 RepID=UPI00126A6F93|nr:hypothetical protein [Inquilinus limosus]
MPVREQDIRRIFNDARAHYKDGEKSTNKLYDLTAPSVYDTDKIVFKALKRDFNIQLSIQKVHENPLRVGNYDNIGEKIYKDNAKYGNCVEMNCLAGYLIRREFPTADIWGISITPPGDHFFVIVNDLPYARNITEMSGLPRDTSSFVVDVWMNICCPAVDYKLNALVKLKNWSAEGKRITSFVAGVNTQFSPDSKEYVNGMMDSQLYASKTNAG